MRILIIRHGDPDYRIDSLTETGWKEAELLSEKLKNEEITYAYVSPLGRAKDTARATLEKKGMSAEVCDWLREFPSTIQRPDVENRRMIAWDWLPQDWTSEPRFFDRNEWKNVPVMKEGHVGEKYDQVIHAFDELLARHGYVRDQDLYRVVRPNNDTIALFCHFGLECVLLSHLMNLSPMILWHGFCAAPSSVSTINSEERRSGIAYFRAASLGDISHLYAGGQKPSFAARFCECYGNTEQRHD